MKIAFRMFQIAFVAVLEIMCSHEAAAQVASGFQEVKSGTGIKIYKKSPLLGWNQWVVVVRLGEGTVRSVTGAASDKPNPAVAPDDGRGNVEKQWFSDLWTEAKRFNSPNRQAMMLVNGEFFENDDNNTPATRLTYGLKVDGSVYSFGNGSKNPEYIRTLAFDSSHAEIRAYSTSTFNDSNWPNVVGGLYYDYDINYGPDPTGVKTYLQGKNMVGLRDGGHTMMFFSSNHDVSRSEAVQVLNDFGADNANIIILDAGSSTALNIAGDEQYVPYGRKIPHGIAAYAGADPAPAPPPSTPPTNSGINLVTYDPNTVDQNVKDGTPFGPNQAFTKRWRITNGGTTTWGPGYRLIFEKDYPMGAPSFINVPTVSPGQTWDPEITFVSPSSAGTYYSYWIMQAPDGRTFKTHIYVKIVVTGSLPADTTAPSLSIDSPDEDSFQTNLGQVSGTAHDSNSGVWYNEVLLWRLSPTGEPTGYWNWRTGSWDGGQSLDNYTHAAGTTS